MAFRIATRIEVALGRIQHFNYHFIKNNYCEKNLLFHLDDLHGYNGTINGQQGSGPNGTDWYGNGNYNVYFVQSFV
jgi:hypothetical protein